MRTGVLLLLGSVTACTGNVQYRYGTDAVEARSTRDGNGRYEVAYIEFDEQGDFWDREQLTTAVGTINGKSKPLLVVYIHGWQNNADKTSRDVGEFHKVLSKLAQTPEVRRQHFDVVGVYLGWRGKQAYDPLLKVLSFPTRKRAATQLGSSNTVTEAIFRVVYEARQKSSRARTVLIGHSFGALVLERAIAQAMTGGLLSGHPVVPADLILMVNSAGEAIYAKQMRDMMMATLRFTPATKCYSRPGGACVYKDEARIISVTSETDRATGWAFPIGAGLVNAPRLYRRYETEIDGKYESQRQFFSSTPGHNRLLLDHDITRMEGDLPTPRARTAFDENLLYPQALQTAGQATPIFATGGPDDAGGDARPWNWWQLNYTGDPEQRSPYWVVKVPKEILHGHGDIFNPNAIDMMVALFRLSNVLEDRQPPRIEVKDVPDETGRSLKPSAALAPAATASQAAPSAAVAPSEAARRAPPAEQPAILQLRKRDTR